MIARRGCVSKWFATDSNASYKFVRRQTTDNILLVVVETWRIAGGHKEQSIDRAGRWSGEVAFVSRLLFPLPHSPGVHCHRWKRKSCHSVDHFDNNAAVARGPRQRQDDPVGR